MKKTLFLVVIAILIFTVWGYKNFKDKYDMLTYEIGDTVKKNDIAVTVNSASWKNGDENSQQEKGYSWMIIDVTIENNSDKIYNIWPIFFELDSMYGEVLTKEWLREGINPGNKTRGKIAFKITEPKKKFKFAYIFCDIEKNEQAIFIIKNID